MTRYHRCTWLAASGLIALGLAGIAPGLAQASGFQLTEQSVTGLGRAFAGSGVAADDASDMFYNPAGAALVEGSKLQTGVTGVFIDAEFSDDGNSTAGGKDDNGGTTGLVPNLFYATDVASNWKLGLSITAPFGLTTDYDDDWVGRYQAIESDLLTLDINPVLAWQINEQVIVGAGVNVQYVDATLSRANPPVANPLAGDAFVEVTGDSWDVGYTLGVIFQPTDELSLGIGYRSAVEHTLKGELDFQQSDLGLDGKYDARTSVEFPQTVSLSGRYSLSPLWEFYTTFRWTGWSSFDALQLEIETLPDEVTPEQWRDTWTASFGASYAPTPQWTLRAGFAFDQTPIRTAQLRTPRIPDSDRDWLTLGASFKLSERLTLDVAYAHLFADESRLDTTVELTSFVYPQDTLSGEYDSTVNLVGVQIQYQF